MSLAPSTLRSYRAAWEALAAEAPADPLSIHAVLSALRRVAHPASALALLSRIRVIRQRAGRPLPFGVEQDLSNGLRRRLPAYPPRQAAPLTAREIRDAWIRNAGERSADFVVVAFASMGRFSDVSRIRQLRPAGRSVVVEWGVRKPAPTQQHPTAVRIAFPPWFVPRRDIWSPLPFRGVTRNQVMRVLPPGFSTHSLRRGAIQAAMEAGASDAEVTRLSGHQSLEALARYAGMLPKTWAEETLAASRAVWARELGAS